MHPRDVDTGEFSHDGGPATFLDNALSSIHAANHCAYRNAMSSQKCDNRNRPFCEKRNDVAMDGAWLKERFEKQPEKTQRALASALGLDPSAITRMISGLRRIQVQEVPKIRVFFGEQESGTTGQTSLYQAVPVMKPPGDLPVMGVGQGGPDGFVDWNGDIVERIARPEALAGVANAYAVYVTGSSMAPRYEEGELVYVHPARPVSAGRYCVVQFADDESSRPRVLIKQFVRRTSKMLVLHQFRPDRDIEIPVDKLIAVHLIVASGER